MTIVVAVVCVSLGWCGGVLFTGLWLERRQRRHWQRVAASEGCPVCRVREYDENTAEIIEMAEYRERHGNKNRTR